MTASPQDNANENVSPNRKNGDEKSLVRSLGAFFGHIVKGIRTDVRPAGETRGREDEEHRVHEVSRTVEERREGSVTFRETVIREVEVDPPLPHDDQPPKQSSHQ